ncbi:MAG: hypothetical protein FH753_01955 [Firmicutes bacterium]|nr:hypothetical protein [Bacillota bacterium]
MGEKELINRTIDVILNHEHIKNNCNTPMNVNTMIKYLKKKSKVTTDRNLLMHIIENHLSDRLYIIKGNRLKIACKGSKNRYRRKTENNDKCKIDFSLSKIKPKIDKMIILNSGSKKCPCCRDGLILLKVDLAIYICKLYRNENVNGYITIDSLYCKRCKNFYIYNEKFQKLKKAREIVQCVYTRKPKHINIFNEFDIIKDIKGYKPEEFDHSKNSNKYNVHLFPDYEFGEGGRT